MKGVHNMKYEKPEMDIDIFEDYNIITTSILQSDDVGTDDVLDLEQFQ